MNQLLSYHNDVKLKKEMVAEMLKHQKQDSLIKGTYGKENGVFKGCAVGCGIHSYNLCRGTKIAYDNHAALAKAIGAPEWLFRLQDALFEGLDQEESVKFPLAFYKALPIGVDLEPVKWKFCAFILKENIERVLTLTISEDLKRQVVEAVQGCLKLHETAINTGKWNESAESAARSAEEAARSAALSAEWSAALSAEWSAALSARWSAESAARSAEWSARWSAESAARSAEEAARSAEWSAALSAGWSARSAAYKKYADELLRLLKATGK